VATIGLTLALIATKVIDNVVGESARSSVVLLALISVWFAVIAILASRATRGLGPLSGTSPITPVPPWLPLTLVPLLVAVFAWPVVPPASELLLSLLLAVGLLFAYRALRPEKLLGRRATIAVDLAAGALILLLVSDVSVYTLESQLYAVDPELGSTLASWLQFHHNPILGPVNDVTAGRSMLVETYSPYGVANMYFLAGVFEFVPIGYGTFGLLVAAGLAVMYAIAYAILRLAGCSPVLAVTAMAAAIVSSVYSPIGSPATFPSLGVMRWGFGYLLVFLAVLSARNKRWAPKIRVAGAVIVGISSIWSFEVFVYTGATYAALVAYWAASRRPGEWWLRSVAKMLAPAALACVVAHLALVLWTVAQTGELPSWGPYLAILREFSTGEYNRLVAPPWWLGVPMGALLFGSAVAVGAIVSRAPDFEAANRAALLAIAGMTAFGIATFTYGVRFSHDDFLLRADLPAVMAIALWIHVAGRSALARPARMVLTAGGFWLAALLIVGGWNDFEREAERTPLVAALPGNGQSLGGAISRTWSNPPIHSWALPAETMLDRYWPGEEKALVLIFPDASVEALMRSGRVNLLPVNDVTADDLVADETWERVRPAIDEIEPGTLMLTESFYLTPGATRDYIVADSGPLPLEQLILDRIRERFRLQPVAREKLPDGAAFEEELIVVRLVERS
jgi:hypothetical protein